MFAFPLVLKFEGRNCTTMITKTRTKHCVPSKEKLTEDPMPIKKKLIHDFIMENLIKDFPELKPKIEPKFKEKVEIKEKEVKVQASAVAMDVPKVREEANGSSFRRRVHSTVTESARTSPGLWTCSGRLKPKAASKRRTIWGRFTCEEKASERTSKRPTRYSG